MRSSSGSSTRSAHWAAPWPAASGVSAQNPKYTSAMHPIISIFVFPSQLHHAICSPSTNQGDVAESSWSLSCSIGSGAQNDRPTCRPSRMLTAGTPSLTSAMLLARSITARQPSTRGCRTGGGTALLPTPVPSDDVAWLRGKIFSGCLLVCIAQRYCLTL